ncbi:unnamed protein product [Calypogeia fissa]
MDSPNVSTQQRFCDAEVEALFGSGIDSMIGQPIFKGSDMLCPISTSSALAIAEQPELRAYKLGKQKCSYNQVELVIKDVGTGKPTELKVSEAIETCVGPEVDEKLRESCLKFNVRFVNNNRMYLYIYVVYAAPYSTTATDEHSIKYHWIPVTRSKCRKGCKGPVIRGLQRFGRMPRRNALTLDGEDSWKEPRHLYIAIDEASTHVCPRHETSKFRLLIAAYDDKNQLLGTTVSSSIRVLANNDAPLGAASFKLHCNIKADCSGLPQSSQSEGYWLAVRLTCLGLLQVDGVQSDLRVSEFSLMSNRSVWIVFHVGPEVIVNGSPSRSYITDEQSKQVELDRSIVTDDKEVDQGVLRDQKIRRSAPADGAGAHPKADKEHTLTDLCHRLFKFCVTKHEHGQTTITLRSLANTLGARRRRVLEILNVLEIAQVIHHQGKERYTWIGSRQIAGALMKLKNTVPKVGEPTDAYRSLLSPLRRAKFEPSLPRNIEDMRTEAADPLRSLTIRFIQLFLIHEQGSAVPWEEILQSTADGQAHDPETIRAKRRRLGEIARIFSALHLIRRGSNPKLKDSGLVYEWLGTQGVADHLYNISSSLACVGGRSTRTHQERVNSPKTQEKRAVSGGLRGRSVYDHDLRSCEVTQGSNISGELSSQALLEASISRHLSPIPRWRIQGAPLPTKKRSSSVPEADVHQVYVSSTLQRDSDLQDAGILQSPCSSETEDEGFPSSDKTDGDSTAAGTCKGRHLTNEPTHRDRSESKGLSKIMDVSGHLLSELNLEPRDDHAEAHCGSLLTLTEEETKTFQPSSIKPLVISDDNTSGVSCSTAHKFPYKKRKFEATSFPCLAEAHRCTSSRDPKLASTSDDPEHDDVRQNRDLVNRGSTFDPLFHLFCFYSPERIFELQSQNPAFFFTYVKESRALYHKWCAPNPGPTLIRPVASVGKVSIQIE